MKAQATVASIVTVVVVLITMLLGMTVFSYVADVTPHDQTINNESICTTCVNGSNGGTTYTFDYTPVLNDSTLICYNDSINLMTNGLAGPTCLGYNIVGLSSINITNTSVDCQTENVVCTYTYDWATADEQSFWDNSTDNSFGGFILASIIVIVLAAIAIITIVLLLGK